MSWKNILKNDEFPENIRVKLGSRSKNLGITFTDFDGDEELGFYDDWGSISLNGEYHFTLEEAKQFGQIFDDWQRQADERKREKTNQENERLAELRDDPNSWEI